MLDIALIEISRWHPCGISVDTARWWRALHPTDREALLLATRAAAGFVLYAAGILGALPA